MLYQERDEVHRQEFQVALSQFKDEQRVWIDECGLDQDLVRLYGRCPCHQRLYDEISGHRISPRISMIAAYCQRSLLAPFPLMAIPILVPLISGLSTVYCLN